MPGRVSQRSSRSSAATVDRKSSTTTLRTRGSASARTSAHAVEIPDEGAVTSLRTQICQVFADATKSAATQRKLVVSLRKIQESCCYEPQNPKKKPVEEYDEEDFNHEVVRCILRVLPVKKGELAADLILRFLGVFLRRGLAADKEALSTENGSETPTGRLTTDIIGSMIQFMTAKDKTVRYRATQAIATITNHMPEVDDELFTLLKLSLLKRLHDKEPSVRAQAAMALGPLSDNDNEDDDEEDDDDDAYGLILNKLTETLQHDPSLEVRKTVLLNLPFKAETMPHLFERARDMEPTIRRLVFKSVLNLVEDFRNMSSVFREKTIRWGLRDRDETVRKAAAALFANKWIENCETRPANQTDENGEDTEMADGNEQGEKKTENPAKQAARQMDALTELLARIDIMRTGWDEGIAHQAMREFWTVRDEYRQLITFDDDYWNDLTAESAFVARSLKDYNQIAEDGEIEDKFPEVSVMSFFIQKHINRLLEGARRLAIMEEPPQELEEMYERQEFVVIQLLYIALTLDYSDEVGRRQIFSIMQNSLAAPELPEECTKLAVEVLRTACGSRASGEKEFCGVILEAIAEVRDTLAPDDVTEKGEDDEESFHSAQSDISQQSAAHVKSKKARTLEEEDPEEAERKQIQELSVYLKCLHITECMLQHVDCKLEDNTSLVHLLNTLVVPAVRGNNTAIREAGVKCLGLCCLLSDDLAKQNFGLFLQCFTKGSPYLQEVSLQILVDMVIVHPSLLAPMPADQDSTMNADADADAMTATVPSPFLKPLTKALLKAFNSSESTLSQISCTAACKLLLMNVLPPGPTADILKNFTLAYFNPETAANPALRQTLSYFIPVFCHSHLRNATLMSQIAIHVLQKLMIMKEELDVDDTDGEMVGWPVVANHLGEWTDGRRVVSVGSKTIGEGTGNGSEDIHVQLAIDVLERALKDTCSKDERKPLLTLLSKLHISATASPTGKATDEEMENLRTLHALAQEAGESKIGPDAASRNFIAKLEMNLTKRLGDVELVTQIAADEQDTDEPTVVPAGKPENGGEEMDVDGMSGVEEDEEEDTMLANVQAEGTRMPLEDDDDDDEEISTVVGGMRRVAVSESDIVDSLLESEL